jgi:hypothetical protein
MIVSPYTATALYRVELLALHKTDYDVFIQEIRSSERRYVFVCVRVCVCVCVLRVSPFMNLCVRLFVCEQNHIVYMCVYMCVSVYGCVCACA